MISKIVAALLTVLLLAAVCLAADKVISDDMIYDNVRIKLASDQIVKGGGIQVESHQGVVTLRGTVQEEKQKDKATRLAKKINGVKSVDNQLQVVEKAERK